MCLNQKNVEYAEVIKVGKKRTEVEQKRKETEEKSIKIGVEFKLYKLYWGNICRGKEADLNKLQIKQNRGTPAVKKSCSS